MGCHDPVISSDFQISISIQSTFRNDSHVSNDVEAMLISDVEAMFFLPPDPPGSVGLAPRTGARGPSHGFIS